MTARFEIVHGANGQWFGRYVAGNNREVWRTSETYTRRQGVDRALNSMLPGPRIHPTREVDERTQVTS